MTGPCAARVITSQLILEPSTSSRFDLQLLDLVLPLSETLTAFSIPARSLPLYRILTLAANYDISRAMIVTLIYARPSATITFC